jgi:hypothetical protein
MKKVWLFTLAVAVVTFLFASRGGAAEKNGTLRLEPRTLQFTGLEAAGKIAVFLGDTAAQSSQVSKASILERKGWMFDVTKSVSGPASITVKTNPKTVEHGSYRLEVTAAGQTAYIDITVNIPGGERQEGMVALEPHMGLNATYKKDTTLEYKVEVPDGTYLVWTLNGKTVLEGTNKKTLVHKFTETGKHDFQVAVKKGDRVISKSEGSTSVIP